MRKATMKVKNQLGIAFGALVVMVLIVSVMSLRSLGNANQSFTGYVQGIDAQSNIANDLREAVNRRAIAVRNLVLVTERQEVDKELALVLRADEDVQKDLAGLKKMVAADFSAPRIDAATAGRAGADRGGVRPCGPGHRADGHGRTARGCRDQDQQ